MYLIVDHENNILCGIPSSNVTEIYFDDIEKAPAGIFHTAWPNIEGDYGEELIIRNSKNLSVNIRNDIDIDKVAHKIVEKLNAASHGFKLYY